MKIAGGNEIMHSPDDCFQKLIDAIAAYNPNADFDLVRKAHAYAASELEGLRLRNGAPALLRPLAVAHTLALLRVDETVVAAGLLYDLQVAIGDIREHFGEETAGIVDGVGAICLMQFYYRENRDGEHARKLQLAMSEDIRVLLVALADCLYRMRSHYRLPLHKAERIVRETMDIYLPLVNSLGLRGIGQELEDLCFRHLQPVAYGRIHDWLEKRGTADEAYVREAIGFLRERLDTFGIQAALEGGVKRVHNMHTEMKARNLALDEFSESTVVNVTANNEKECYEILGLAHAAWRPLPGRFKDYIAAPAGNMDQRLQTTVVGPRGKRTELRIRTEKMGRRAETGMLSHWWNEEGVRVKTDGAERLRWLRAALDLENNWPQDSSFWDEIFVFTPKGATTELPKGATPVDFAYKIHTEVGNRCVGAKINGQLMPLNTELRSGDVVEIITHAKVYPNPDWLESVKTRKAQKCIRRFIRAENAGFCNASREDAP